MYVFNIFCFGHKVDRNKELNNFMNSCGIEFSKKIRGKIYEVYFPYHGDRVRGDTFPCIFGVNITDDDNNPNYINEIRSVKEEDYTLGYKEFISDFIKEIESQEDLDSKEKKLSDKLILFLNSTEPEFYSVEASS